jgi:hydrogenase nickel incorporation protein HypA/HybF
MHEFSIIQNIIEIVTSTAELNNVKEVHAVEVEVGMASGVVREAMEFAWNAGTKGTMLEHAELKIKEIPLAVKCNTCGHHYQPCEIYESCPGCGDVDPEVITGKELRVVALDAG